MEKAIEVQVTTGRNITPGIISSYKRQEIICLSMQRHLLIVFYSLIFPSQMSEGTQRFERDL